MTIRIYNSLSRQKEVFEPVEPGKVRMYVCGPTVYDSCHIGHARSVVVFDVIYRYLKARGYDVFYVRNFTDVDDKIIARANATGMTSDDISERYIKEFHEDMASLNMVRPTMEPRATAHIEQIVNIISILIDKGYAYESDGDVYFSVEKYTDYGKLSGRRLEEMVAGSRVEIDPRKRNPFDFVLWKASKPDEPQWDSPWGKGRPGWHIECSAMAYRYLGPQIDIHGGGHDLVYPHHESEIAQSEYFTGQKPFSRFWVHVAMVRYQGEKMSKSLGNMVFVRDVLRYHTADALRLYLHSNHYRESFEYLDDGPAKYGQLAADLKKASRIDSEDEGDLDLAQLSDEFFDALKDDLNTPVAVVKLGKMASEVIEAAVAGNSVGKAQEQLRVAASMFGLQGTR